MTFVERLEVLYAAGEVKRLHTVPTLKSRTVAAHVYGAQCIAEELCALNTVPPGPVLHALLYHDAPEVETGDVPAPTKRASKEIDLALEAMEEKFCKATGIPVIAPRFFSVLEYDIVKAADYLDLGMICVQELMLGNRHQRIGLVLKNIIDYTRELEVKVLGVAQLRGYLTRMGAKYGC